MAARGSLSEGGVELRLLLPGGRSVAHVAPASCPMMDLLVQIASKENLKPSAYVMEAVDVAIDDEDPSSRPIIKYKPNTPVGQLNTQVIRLVEKNCTGSKMPPPTTNGTKARETRITYSESFSNRVQNFNKMSGVSAVQICNDPDGFTKLSEDTKRIKSRSNFITSTLPPQVSADSACAAGTFASTFRLQIHLPCEQLHVIRASPEYAVRDVLDIIREERGLKLERYSVHKTNEPDLILDINSTLKEYGITELTLKLLPEFEIKRNVHPKKVKKENSSHFRSAFKSFFQQLKPSSRSNSISELNLPTGNTRPKSEPPVMHTEYSSRAVAQQRVPPRKRGPAPPPPVRGSAHDGPAAPRSHTASESSCESAGEGSVGGSAPATLPRRCRLGVESASTMNLAIEPPLPPLRRGVSDMAVNKPKFARRKRVAPKPPTPIAAEELVEDGLEELAAQQKMGPQPDLNSSSHKATGFGIVAVDVTSPNEDLSQHAEYHNIHSKDQVLSNDEAFEEITEERPFNNNDQMVIDKGIPVDKNCLTHEYKLHDQDDLLVNHKVPSILEDDISAQNGYQSVYSETGSILNVVETIHDDNQLVLDGDSNTEIDSKKIPINTNLAESKTHSQVRRQSYENGTELHKYVTLVDSKNLSVDDRNEIIHEPLVEVKKNEVMPDIVPPVIYDHKKLSAPDRLVNEEKKPLESSAANDAPAASHVASSYQVDCPLAVDIPALKVFPTSPKTVESISPSHTVTPLLTKVNDNHSRSAKPSLVQKSASVSTTVSKPTVDELLKQIQIIKQNKQLKRSQSNVVEKYGTALLYESRVNKQVADLPSKSPIVIKPSSPDGKSRTIERIKSQREYEPPDSFPKPRSNSNGTIDTTDLPWLASEAIDTYDPSATKSRELTKFMLTSWAEERAPVVKRIADYGSRGSSTQVSGAGAGGERVLPSALAATLPRPFTRSHSEMTTNFSKPATVNTLPTIINVVEKVTHTKVNDTSNPTGRTSAYSKLNLYNMSPTILPDPRSIPYSNGHNAVTVNVATKPSWELVNDASKKLAQTATNGDAKVSDENANDTKLSENGGAKEPVARHMYKYPKPLQFQLGTWNDKTKTIKIEQEANLGQKEDPPLVKELDEVGVWSATY